MNRHCLLMNEHEMDVRHDVNSIGLISTFRQQSHRCVKCGDRHILRDCTEDRSSSAISFVPCIFLSIPKRVLFTELSSKNELFTLKLLFFHK